MDQTQKATTFKMLNKFFIYFASLMVTVLASHPTQSAGRTKCKKCEDALAQYPKIPGDPSKIAV